MDDYAWIKVLQFLALPLGFFFWWWLISMIFGRTGPEQRQLPPRQSYRMDVPNELTLIDRAVAFELIWCGAGPDISVQYAEAKQSTAAWNVSMRVASLWAHQQYGLFLHGSAPEGSAAVCVQLSKVRSDIFVGDVIYTANDFVKRLCAGLLSNDQGKLGSTGTDAPDAGKNALDVSKQSKFIKEIWRGEGPTAVFSAWSSSRVDKTVLQIWVTGLYRSDQQGDILQGRDLKSGETMLVPEGQIATSIAVGQKHYPVAVFLSLLQAGNFQAETPEPARKAKKPVVKMKSATSGEVGKNSRPVLMYHDTKRERRRSVVQAGGSVDWRKEGILSLSGYHVGKTNGKKEAARRSILNTLLLDDDLEDVPDRGYAAQWGAPETPQRFKKIHDSISTFKANAERRHSRKLDMSHAIHDWECDLKYLDEKLRRLVQR